MANDIHVNELEAAAPAARGRDLPLSEAFRWLAGGWRDFTKKPWLSLVHGIGVLALSALTVAVMFAAGWDHILFPALSGFMIVGPLIAIGTYEKSRRLAAGEPLGLRNVLFGPARSGGQIFFVGLILALLMVFWMRAAVLIYALFFGYRPFPGLDQIAPMLFTTPIGWAMLLTGTVVGGIFAAFAYAISVFAIPMLLDRRTDALTAMGTSMALVWNNLPVMLMWGGMVLTLFLLAVATGLLGLVIIFPLLGHATWHAYEAIARS
ncbi:DUF2189 domain-containing protein [Chelativorans sp. AA-79]|uniref:DUF2189 domain-containing protein n=1 Tax=Chelativorans sp. AA-79 TaxID=3028735 RepID=UPI0023F91B24|nr:DUF2189 domain-containing protein [Chelativorans sp. AA-79]WEX10816.1 DUF2189 domain-containing protein [Chelativorans sp. AA-79]